jgi:hypothetical protein
LQVALHCGVRLVHPRGEAVDARGGICDLHGFKRIGACVGIEIAVENRIVVDAAFGLARKHGGSDTRIALH